MKKYLSISCAVMVIVSTLTTTDLFLNVYAQDSDPYVTVDKTATAYEIVCGQEILVNLTVMGTGIGGPVDVMLMIDRSGSMDGYPLEAAKDAAKSFVDKLSFTGDPATSDWVGISSYSTTASLDQGLTDNSTLAKSAIDGLSDGDFTNIMAAVHVAQEELATNGRNHAMDAIILLSDGVANRWTDFDTGITYSTTTWPMDHTESTLKAIQEATWAKGNGTIVFTIGLNLAALGVSEAVARDTLEQMATSPEHFFDAATPGYLEEIYGIIASYLGPAATDLTIRDTVEDEFSIVMDSFDPAPTSVVGNTITWEFDVLGSETRIFQYKIRPILGLHGWYLTNVEAKLIYTDHEDNPAVLWFPLPEVYLYSVCTSAIQLIKTVDPTLIHPGEKVIYIYVVTNLGSYPLHNVNVTDDQYGEIAGRFDLAVREMKTFTHEAYPTETVTNWGNATGKDPWNYPVTDLDDATVEVITECTVTFYVDPPEGGNITIVGGQTYLNGQSDTWDYCTTLTTIANAHEGYEFVGWEVTGNLDILEEIDNALRFHIACGGNLKAFFAGALAPPNSLADLGNLTDEASHNLIGWGAAQGPPENPHVSPSGDRTKRYQLLRGDNSVDLRVDEAGVPYFLTAEVEDGYCTDNFEIYVNGEGPIYEYIGKNVGTGPVTIVSHQVLVPAEYITRRRVTITFRNTATDDCGLAAVYNVGLTPTPPPEKPPKFLTLPFRDPDIKIQQGWIYTWDPDPDAHKGIDFIKGAIDRRETWQSFDIVAAADGWAMWSEQPGSTGVYGKFVFIRHDEKDDLENDYFTLYAHLESVAMGIPYQDRHNIDYNYHDASKWKFVERGEVIGRAGNTGALNTGIHLHFEVQRGGYFLGKTDPYDLYKTRDFYPSGSSYAGCGQNHLWTTDPPSLSPALSDDIQWLAKTIINEAEGCAEQEQIAVGWTVLNRLYLGRFGESIQEIVVKGYAPYWREPHKEPTDSEINLAEVLLEGKIPDPTDGATHFFSPRSMTSGYGPYPVPGTSEKALYPYWAEPRDGWEIITETTTHYVTVKNELEWRQLEGIRNWYFMFCRPYRMRISAGIGSPGEFRVYDSQGRVTGLVNGTVVIGIPGSVYFENTVVIFLPNETYRYVVVGATEGLYDLTVTAITRKENITFSAIDIPTSVNATHQYIIDWDALSVGEEGVAVQIDSNGDRIFEQTFTSDGELSYSEYLDALNTINTWITDSDFNETESFRAVFTPDGNTELYKLTATNPGQFYFNILVNNTWPEPLNMTITYSIDANFTTQGARPIHVYADLNRTIDITANCTFSDNTITVYNLAPNATAYVTIHLDYALKGTTWTAEEVEAWYSEHAFNATVGSVTFTVVISDAEPQTA